MTDDDEPASTPEHFGRYRLIQRIGRGGMAEVFRAYVDGSQHFASTFVIKRIRPEKSDLPELVSMFCEEARITALLQHPNIVEVYDFGQIGGAYFMAMEYLRGRDLAAVMRALRAELASVPFVVAARVARDVGLGLEHAHGARYADGRAAEIVHRDVTPSNVMLLRAGGVKVLDFGIAKAAAAARPETPGTARKSRVRGKLAYLSPEQVRNAELDGRSDVFSLGVVLWEMLVGQRLFAGESEFQTLRNVLTMPVPPPSERREGVPRVLDAVVARALARERDERFPSARAFVDALERAAPEASSPSAEIAVGELLGTLFGDGDLGVSTGRFTSTFTAVTEESLSRAAPDPSRPAGTTNEEK
ncbi:MAG TPA: serine/threonine-protein kinase [Polyangia bacterium]|nr:serine/threonine-protein kinase [Polyangia bacterium]